MSAQHTPEWMTEADGKAARFTSLRKARCAIAKATGTVS